MMNPTDLTSNPETALASLLADLTNRPNFQKGDLVFILNTSKTSTLLARVVEVAQVVSHHDTPNGKRMVLSVGRDSKYLYKFWLGTGAMVKGQEITVNGFSARQMVAYPFHLFLKTWAMALSSK